MCFISLFLSFFLKIRQIGLQNPKDIHNNNWKMRSVNMQHEMLCSPLSLQLQPDLFFLNSTYKFCKKSNRIVNEQRAHKERGRMTVRIISLDVNNTEWSSNNPWVFFCVVQKNWLPLLPPKSLLTHSNRWSSDVNLPQVWSSKGARKMMTYDNLTFPKWSCSINYRHLGFFLSRVTDMSLKFHMTIKCKVVKADLLEIIKFSQYFGGEYTNLHHHTNHVIFSNMMHCCRPN